MSSEDTKMSEERLREVFTMFDKDGDATISTKELVPIMSTLGLNPTPKRMKSIMRQADQDRNGKLDFGEFSALMNKYLRTEEEGAALEMTGYQHATENAFLRRKREDINETIKEVFKRYDDNNDGTINTTELLAIMQTLGNNPTKLQMKKIMADADKDGNGKLDLAEFGRVMSKYLLSPQQAKLEIMDAFHVFDKDGSGTIEFMELKEILQMADENISDKEIQDIFDELDENGDGVLNIEEFAKIATTGFI